MKQGDLVKWTLSWIVMRREDAFWDNVDYSKQVGVLEREWALGSLLKLKLFSKNDIRTL